VAFGSGGQVNKTLHIRSLRDVQGLRQARIYSIPKQQRSVHLDLYVLAREKERLETELFQLQAKVSLIKKRLAQSNKRMTGLMREIGRAQETDSTKKDKTLKPAVTKMRIDY
jgi:chromosome segregation ATPase